MIKEFDSAKYLRALQRELAKNSFEEQYRILQRKGSELMAFYTHMRTEAPPNVLRELFRRVVALLLPFMREHRRYPSFAYDEDVMEAFVDELESYQEKLAYLTHHRAKLDTTIRVQSTGVRAWIEKKIVAVRTEAKLYAPSIPRVPSARQSEKKIRTQSVRSKIKLGVEQEVFAYFLSRAFQAGIWTHDGKGIPWSAFTDFTSSQEGAPLKPKNLAQALYAVNEKIDYKKTKAVEQIINDTQAIQRKLSNDT